MDLLQGIETRRSFRAFKSTPIPRETIERILEAASKSPSCALARSSTARCAAEGCQTGAHSRLEFTSMVQ